MGGQHHVAQLAARLKAVQPSAGLQAVLTAALPGLQALDGRACAALLKDLCRAEGAHYATARCLFDWLRQLPPSDPLAALCDVYTYTTLIACCDGVHGDLVHARELFDEMRARGVAGNVHSYSALISACIKADQIGQALQVLRDMQAAGVPANVVTYSTLLEALSQKGLWREALGLLEEMQGQGLAPNARTLTAALIACNVAGQLDETVRLWRRMRAAGVEASTGGFNAVIAAHARLGQTDAAVQLLRDMQAARVPRSLASVNPILAAAERAGDAALALFLLDHLSDGEGPHKLSPSTSSYSAAIGACTAGGEPEAAARLLRELQESNERKFGSMAGPAPAYMANILDKCGRWPEAWAMYEQLTGRAGSGGGGPPPQPPDPLWVSAVLDTLWNAGSRHACMLAHKAFSDMCNAHLFRLGVDVDEINSQVRLRLPCAGFGMASIALWSTFDQLRARLLASGGQPLLRSSTTLIVGDPNIEPGPMREVVQRACCMRDPPGFKLCDVPASDLRAGLAVVAEAPSEQLAAWLLSNTYLQQRPYMPSAEEVQAADPRQLLAEAQGLLQGCQEAWRVTYLQQAAPPQLQPALITPAVSEGGVAPGSRGSSSALSSAAGSADAASSSSFGLAASSTGGLAGPAGPADEAGNSHDTGSSIDGSAAEALGLLARCLGIESAGSACEHCILGHARSVLDQAAAAPAAPNGNVSGLLALPPATQAVLALQAGRRAFGLYPDWPKALLLLTGVPGVRPEHEAMVQLLCQQAQQQHGQLQERG